MDEYENQASDFLQSTNTTMTYHSLGVVSDFIKGYKNEKFSVCLQNDNHVYYFDFHSSAANLKAGMRAITNYDVLACLNIDYSTSFADFCAGYGYPERDEDYNIVMESVRVWDAVRKETSNLKRLFSEAQLEQLAEIN